MLWIFSLIDYHFCSLGAALQQPVCPALQDKPCLHENRVSVQLPGSGATCWPPASETPGGSESPALPNIQGTDVCRCEDLLSVVNYALKSHIVFWRSHTNLMVLCLKVNNLNLCLAQAVWKVEAQLEASWCWFLHFILWLMVCLDPRVFLETKPVHVFFFLSYIFEFICNSAVGRLCPTFICCSAGKTILLCVPPSVNLQGWLG